MQTGAYVSADNFTLAPGTVCAVRNQWNRVVFMQTNREDVGKRFLEIKVPIPLRKEISDKISELYKDYFKSLNEIRDKLSNSLYAVNKKYTISD